MKTTTQTWVVLVTETYEDGETVCQVVADGFATEAEAEDAAYDAIKALGQAENRLVEVCTEEEAAAVVTE